MDRYHSIYLDECMGILIHSSCSVENMVFKKLEYYTFWVVLDALHPPTEGGGVLGRLGHPQASFFP